MTRSALPAPVSSRASISSRHRALGFALIAASPVCAFAKPVVAQEIQIRGPLAGASSCRHCVEYRTGRLSVTPTVGITLQDEYDRAVFVGANLQFHVNDVLAVGVWGAIAAAHIPTALTSGIEQYTSSWQDGVITRAQYEDPSIPRSNATPNIPRGEFYGRQIGQLNWMISAPQLTVVPLRGKLSLFESFYIDADFYVFAGLGIIGLSERASFDAVDSGGSLRAASGNDADVRANQLERASRVAFTGTFGAGLNFYITQFVSVSFEYRAFPFAWNTSGTDESSTAATCGAHGDASCAGFPDYQVQADGSANAGGRFKIDATDQSFHWNQMVNLGINVFLPPSAHIGE